MTPSPQSAQVVAPASAPTSTPRSRSDQVHRDGRFFRWTLGTRWWIGATLGYLLSRLLALLAFMVARALVKTPDVWDFQPDSVWKVMTQGWDGVWYRRIAEHGYPDVIPLGAEGLPEQTALPFYPLFPFTSRLLSFLPGVSAPGAGVVISLVCGLLSVFLVRRLILLRTPDLVTRRPWFVFTAPLVFAFFPSAGVFSANYSEGLALVLLLAALLAVMQDRLWSAAILILLLGLVRPLAVPLGLVVLARHTPEAWRVLRTERRVPWRQVRAVSLLGVTSVISVLLWPVITALLTGRSDALSTAQGAWPRPSGSDPSQPLSVLAAETGSTWSAALVTVCMLVPLTMFTLRSVIGKVGVEVVAWTSGYLLFLLVTVGPSNSTLRYFLLAVGLNLLLAAGVRRGWQAAVLLTALGTLQFLWIVRCWSGGLTP